MSLMVPCPRCGLRPSGGVHVRRRAPARSTRRMSRADFARVYLRRERGGSAARAMVPRVRVPALAHRDARHRDEPDRRAVTVRGAPGRGTTRRDRGRRHVASAMYRAGVRTFTRSLKYHRRRGLYCLSGDCPNCLVTVDGQPGVRACVTPAREGQDVRRASGWPSTEHDALHVTDRLHRLMPVGVLLEDLHPAAVRVAARRARDPPGDGHRAPAGRGRRRQKPVRAVHVDVLVVGRRGRRPRGRGRGGDRGRDDVAGRGARAGLRRRGTRPRADGSTRWPPRRARPARRSSNATRRSASTRSRSCRWSVPTRSCTSRPAG